ncbi:MAG: hypothetical protein D6732_13170 [Methanobacteriota archaeon]|nr:MAG: hypothetical protein D6732_13170 [Euryarchaeota archaeon]
MSIRRRKKKIELDELLPEEVVESTETTTVEGLAEIVNQIKEQLDEAMSKFETLTKDLVERIELLESDFKQVAQALQKAQQSGGAAPSGPPSVGPPSGGPPMGGPRPPTGPPTGGPKLS